MVTCPISNDRTKPQVVTGHESAAMIGARFADTIRASGHTAPRKQAGHMIAPDRAPITSKKTLATQGPSTHDD